jgi:hypothetical protein
LERYRDALKNEKIYFVEDIVVHRSYKQHAPTDPNFLKNILIKHEGEVEPLGSVSLHITEPAPRVARMYFRSGEERDRAQTIFRGL